MFIPYDGIDIFLVTYTDWKWWRRLLRLIKILRIKKQFMIYPWADYSQRFNKQATVRSLFFWAKHSETQDSRYYFWKYKHQNQNSTSKLISTHFGRPRLEEWGLGIIYIPPKWQLIPEAKESFLFFPGSVFNAAEGSFSSECFLYFDGQS